MIFIVLLIIYFVVGIVMVMWDFRPNNTLHDPPRFIKDRSVTTAIAFIVLWPYKLFRK